MEIINSLMTWFMKKRIHEVELFMKYPIEVQKEVFAKLLHKAKNTEFGKKYHFHEIKTLEDFQSRVPISDYESLFPYIDRVMQGEQNLLWPTEIKWFAKSSGTTNAKSKFIPVSEEALEDCHFKGGKDLLSIYFNNHPDTKFFTGKSLALGGSHDINQLDKSAASFTGDISAVIMKNLPFWAQMARTPSLEVALINNWEEKIEKIARETSKENVTNISGIPTWTLVLLRRIMEIKQVDNILEVWPNLEVFFHGAVSFTPYRKLFEKVIPSSGMNYYETYNATEGFFGIQDVSNTTEMLLMLDYGIFYEFIPLEHIDDENPRVLTLAEVQLNTNYAIIISTNAGLWRYKIGDTIKFTSLAPFRIQISGRTRHFINSFGEEIIIENAEKAITRACDHTGAIIENFTAGPKFFENGASGCHEWLVEFRKLPDSLSQFTTILDESLKAVNSDYEAKRAYDMVLETPIVQSLPADTFAKWMKGRGKLGGQNKVPRLANNREYLDDILKMLN